MRFTSNVFDSFTHSYEDGFTIIRGQHAILSIGSYLYSNADSFLNILFSDKQSSLRHVSAGITHPITPHPLTRPKAASVSPKKQPARRKDQQQQQAPAGPNASAQRKQLQTQLTCYGIRRTARQFAKFMEVSGPLSCCCRCCGHVFAKRLQLHRKQLV